MIGKNRKIIFFSYFILSLFSFSAIMESESLTITTYYPAPYGAYTKLLTTGDTILSRDSGKLIVGASSSTQVEKLYLSGDMYITGYIKNLCTWRTMAASATPTTAVSCNAGEVLTAVNYTGFADIGACSGAQGGTNYCVYGTKKVGLSGQMLCCKLL